MVAYSQWTPVRKERLALGLLTTFLLGWITVCMVVAGLQLHNQGYGSGIGDGNRLPEQVRYEFHRPDLKTPQELMDATSK